MSEGAEASRGAARGLRPRDGVVLPAWSVRGLAGVLLLGAAGTPWLAPWLGVVPMPEPEVVVEDDTRVVVDLRPELVRLPGGSFRMGSPPDELGRDEDEGPQHEAEVAAFDMCRTEVTQGQWKAVMGTEPFHCQRECGHEHPAQNVSWNDAVRFMNRLTERENALRGDAEPMTSCYEEDSDSWVWTNQGCTGYRLPTETEWEYATRADTVTAYANEGDAALLRAYAWYAENSEMSTRVVGRKMPNRWGLYDVHGNVQEWVWDRHGEYPLGATPEMYTGPEAGKERVVRGGSFADVARYLRSADRDGQPPTGGYVNIGFRCARSVSPPAAASGDLGDTAAAR